jgi:oligosaccharide repeat unit polymerase
MTIELILIAGILSVFLGRWMFGKWFNHVALYGAIWGGSLALFCAGFVPYYPLAFETWVVIIAGWIGFILGSASVVCARFALGLSTHEEGRSARDEMEPDLRMFTIVLWVLNTIVVFDMIHLIRVISHLIGGLNNFFAVAGFLYHLRVTGGIPGAIPYLSGSALSGCLLGGIYIARRGTVRLVALIPLVVIIINSMLSLDRGTIITAAVLFASGYAIESKKDTRVRSALQGTKIRRIISLAVAVALIVTGLEFIRSNRGIAENYFVAGSALSRLQGSSFVTPSIFFYVTGHFGVLNQYLRKDIEHNIVGRYTLAPIWRTFANIGFDTKVPGNQPFYPTPIAGNNGTYLRELRADYGMAGIAFGPFVLGALASFFWFRALRREKLIDMMILGHLLVVVVISIFQVATQQGSWLASLSFGLMLAWLIDRNSSLRQSWTTANQH